MTYSLWNIGTPRAAVSKSKSMPGPVVGYLLRADDGSWTIEGDAPYSYATPDQAAETLLLRGKAQWMRFKSFEMTVTPHAGKWVGWVQDTELHNGQRLLPEEVQGATLAEVKYNASKLALLRALGTAHEFEDVCEALAQTDWNGIPPVRLSDSARRVLSHLAMAPEAYLLGEREGDAPLRIMDSSSAQSPGPQPFDSVERAVVDELVSAEYIQEDLATDHPSRVVYKISDKGHRLFPPSVAT